MLKQSEKTAAHFRKNRLTRTRFSLTLKEKAENAQVYGLSHFSKKENLVKLVKVIEDIL